MSMETRGGGPWDPIRRNETDLCIVLELKGINPPVG